MAGIEDVLERMREQGGERERRYGPRDPANPMWHASREFGYQGWRPDYVVNRDKGEPQADDAGEEEQMLRKVLPMLSTSAQPTYPDDPPPGTRVRSSYPDDPPPGTRVRSSYPSGRPPGQRVDRYPDYNPPGMLELLHATRQSGPRGAGILPMLSSGFRPLTPEEEEMIRKRNETVTSFFGT